MTIDDVYALIWAQQVRLRRSGSGLKVRSARTTLTPELIAGLREHKEHLLERIDREAGGDWWSPPVRITPGMLPLVELSQEQIDRVVAAVPGGVGNVQDIYPLAPLQEGMLFHHLMAPDADSYVQSHVFEVDTWERLDAFLGALREVVGRHDILRTSFHWTGLSRPVQVVHRRADVVVAEVEAGRLAELAKTVDLGSAPVLRVFTAVDPAGGGWRVLVVMHHMLGDNTSFQILLGEVGAVLAGQGDLLPVPVPYRNVVAQAVLGVSGAEHEEFFTGMLAGVEEPCAPYGVLDVIGGGARVASVSVDGEAGARVRELARRSGVSAASVFHLAWALVLARLTGRDDVVFGTVLFGRLHGGAGAGRGLGLFMNTLPIRLGVA
ncbi:hypothetical protein E1294_51070, partial [Nonomuraea diastatica]